MSLLLSNSRFYFPRNISNSTARQQAVAPARNRLLTRAVLRQSSQEHTLPQVTALSPRTFA
jgi:hypothetical protein